MNRIALFSFALTLAGSLFGAETAQTAAAASSGRYAELRIYHAAPGKTDAILERFRTTTWALRKRHGLNPLACWVSADHKASNAIVVQLLAPPSEAAAAQAWKDFSADPDFKAASAASEAKHGKTVDRVETIKVTSPADVWHLANNPRRPKRAFELRIYQRSPGKEAAFRDRWRDHVIRLMQRQGMEPIGWWEAIDAEHKGVMATMLAHESVAAIDAAITAFHKDEEWIRVAKETDANGPLRTGLSTYKLEPVDFSPVQ